jgi:selenide, water dikinase
MTRPLTDYAACGGCASKLAAGDLAHVLSDLPAPHDDRVLIDFRTHDDAGVYRLDGSTALVQTVDFFTPVVNDPYEFGQIAAANALSDVYAMGGRPLTALAVTALPAADLEPGVVQAIFQGGFDKLTEAGVVLLGGHTVRDSEIKFGYAVTGTIHPDEVWSNAGVVVGDVLILTKRLGTGIVSTAIKRGQAPASLERVAIDSMRTLNRKAAETLRAQPTRVHACTDVTGFGLTGHATKMADASGVTIVIDPGRVPLFDGVRALALDHTPGGGRTNHDHFASRVRVNVDVDPSDWTLLFDPQTSGGLLAAVSAAAAPEVLSALRAAGLPAVCLATAIARVDAATALIIDELALPA